MLPIRLPTLHQLFTARVIILRWILAADLMILLSSPTFTIKRRTYIASRRLLHVEPMRLKKDVGNVFFQPGTCCNTDLKSSD